MPGGASRSLFDLTGRVALVAGGGGALGREIARGLSEWGAPLVLADLDVGLGVALFLASSASDFVVGQTISVDGGRTLG